MLSTILVTAYSQSVPLIKKGWTTLLYSQIHLQNYFLKDVNGISYSVDEAMGVMTPYSFIPHPVTKYENDMTYLQRCYNTLLHLFEAAVRKFSYIPAQDKLVKKYFHDGIKGDMPHIQDIIRNISVVLSNSFRVAQKRPKMVSQVDIGSAHIKDPYTLPSDLKVSF
jgi:glucuronosyltransferase